MVVCVIYIFSRPDKSDHELTTSLYNFQDGADFQEEKQRTDVNGN